MSRRVQSTEKVLDASPDYSDLPSLMHSTTARWPTPEEKCGALFYWNQGVRRTDFSFRGRVPKPRESLLPTKTEICTSDPSWLPITASAAY